METKYENSGNLFGAANSVLVREGTADIDGFDHELVVVKTVTSKQKKTIYKICKVVGIMYENDEKTEKKDWDASGEIDIYNEKYMAWARKRTDKNGNDYTRMSFAPAKSQQDDRVTPPQSPPIPDDKTHLDDDIPF